jgi:hypothetical protein
MYAGLYVKYPLFLRDCNENWIFLPDFRKILEFQFHENASNWDEFCHTDRQDKGNSCFSQFYKRAQNEKLYRFFWYPVSLETLFPIWRQSSGPIFKSWPLLTRPLHCLETLETNHSVMQGHSPEEQIPHPYHCKKNLKTHILKTWCKCQVKEIYINRKNTEITSLKRKCKQPST